MKLSKLVDLRREQVSADSLSKLQSIRWMEKFLRDHGLADVMEENATGFSTFQGTHWETLKDERDWDGRKVTREEPSGQFFATIFVPEEYKVLVQRALMKSSTDFGLDWKKQTMLSHNRPFDGEVPFMFETWTTRPQDEDSWYQHEVDIIFYWVPEIGDKIGNCTIELHEEHTAAKTKKVVKQICRKPADD